MKSLWTKRRHVVVLLAAALGIVSLGDDCQGDIVNDPTFRDWCGDSLCSWTLDSGKIAQAPTWNADDLGVSFKEMGTQISQVTGENQATCILFTTVANTDPAAQMTLELDFNNDGIIDYTAPIAGTWTQAQTEITAPAVYDGITFHIRKAGSGTAILAEMRIQSTTGCTAAATPLKDQPLGDACGADDECKSRICSDPAYANPSQVCAQCSSKHPCQDGGTCMGGPYGFAQCDPGEHKGTKGAACAANGDCASDKCDNVTFLGPAGVTPDAGDAASCRPDTADAGSSDTDADAATTDASAADASLGSADGGFLVPTFPCLGPPTLVQGGTCD
jgi:hypothetical protein